jgi:hypothetical protein
MIDVRSLACFYLQSGSFSSGKNARSKLMTEIEETKYVREDPVHGQLKKNMIL